MTSSNTFEATLFLISACDRRRALATTGSAGIYAGTPGVANQRGKASRGVVQPASEVRQQRGRSPVIVPRRRSRGERNDLIQPSRKLGLGRFAAVSRRSPPCERLPTMAAPAPQPYKRVGQYDLYHVIGQGSFASVYRGEHRPTRRVVAIKAIVRARLNRKLQVRTYRPDRFYLFHSRQHHHRTLQTHAPLSNKQLTSDASGFHPSNPSTGESRGGNLHPAVYAAPERDAAARGPNDRAARLSRPRVLPGRRPQPGHP